MLERITSAGARVAVVVLDACRNNPLQTADRRSVGDSRGLMRAEPVKGVFSIYSAGFGQQALDRLGADDRHPNSVFTRVFIEKLKTPGLDLKAVATQTRRACRGAGAKVGHDQFPAYYDQIIGGDVHLAGLLAAPVQTGAPSPLPRAVPCATADAHWKSTETIGSKAAFEDHLERFPNCAFAGLARAKLATMVPPVAPATPPTPVQPAVGRFPSVGALKPGDTFKDCDDCPEMVVVPSGSFTRGSPASEKDRFITEGPQRRVTFARQFAAGRFAVTFDEWDACVGDGGCNGHRPSDSGWGRGKRPVINVSWDDAKAYVAWLSRKTGRSYRLLSEAEREYVTRAGTTTPFWWGSSMSTSQANYDGNSAYDGPKGEYRKQTVPVDSFQPNPFGLHQVHGNVGEWTEDCWNSSYNGAPSDGSAWTSGACSRRVVRNGSWYSSPWTLRSANRDSADSEFAATNRINTIGFRVARTL